VTVIQEQPPAGRRTRPSEDEVGAALAVLLHELEPGAAALVREALGESAAAIELHEAPQLGEARAWLASGRADCVLVALGDPGTTGLASLTAVRETCMAPVVMLVGEGSTQSACLEAIRAGAQDCLSTDQLGAGRLEYAIRCAIQRHAAGGGDEQALLASERRYRGIVEAAGEGIATIDDDWVITFCNQRLADMLRYRPEDLIGVSTFDLVHPDDVAGSRARWKGNSDPSGPVELRYRRTDGTIIWGLISRTRQCGEDGAGGWLAVVTDITAHKAVEQDLGEREQRFRAVFDSASDAILIADDDRRFVEANPAACRLFGRTREQLLSLRIEDVAAPVAGDGVAGSGGMTITRPDGEQREIEYASTANVSPGRHLSVARDVTTRNRDEAERLEMEHRLNQSERMETVGQLAGGVAHDFNNVLSIIVNYTELARSEPDLEAARADLAEIAAAAARGRALTRQLLIVSRRDVSTPEVFDLVDLVRSVQQLLERVIGERIRIEVHFPGGPVAVSADRGRVDQLIMNLALNARDAMPAGGTLSIGVDRRRPAGGARVGDVELTVSDNGVGMVDAVAARAFEPFYTTKGSGRGVGLGLATAYGIVADAGGQISLRSRLGEGTVVHVVLPGTDSDPQSAGPEPPDGHSVAGDGRRVLIVEDDPQVLTVTRRVLERHGYLTSTAASGEAAMAQIGRASVNVVLTDLVMPGMSGVALAQSIRVRRPDIAVVCMSGYSDRRGLLPDDVEILEKPFTPAELLAVMARAGARE
jgi:two-component system cell cycle sensor histidine kinase/response regulator CckA